MPADWDDMAVWAFALCCKGGPPPGPFLPPTIRFNPDTFTGRTDVWTINTPIDSEQNVTGTWTDPDNPYEDPGTLEWFGIQHIKIYFGEGTSDERTGQGFMFIDNPFAPAGGWSFSTSGNHIKLSDDNRTVRVVITDANGLTATAAVTLQIPYDDVVRATFNHPSFEGSNFQWVFPISPSWTLDRNSGGTDTWVENVPTGWGGGIVVPTSGLWLELTGDQALGNVGQWQPRFQIMMPAATNEFETFTRIQIWAEPNGIPWPVEDPRYDITTYGGTSGFTESYFTNGAGDTVSDLVNIVTYDEVLGSGRPFNINDGDRVRIIITGGALDGNGDPILSPTNQQLPLLTFSDMNQTSTAPAPPDPGKVFWSWFGGLITQEAWDTYRAGLPVGIYGRPRGTNAPEGRITFTSPVPYGTVHQLQAGSGYEVPTMNGEGTLICDRSFSPAQDSHSQVVPRGNYEAFTSGFYLRPQRTYRMTWTMNLASPLDRAVWEQSSFKVLFDLHCGSWGPNWVDSRTPIIAWQLHLGSMYVVTRGTNETVPTQYLFSNQSPHWPIPELGVTHNFRMEFRWDPLGTTSFCKAWFNNSQIADIAGTIIGVNASGASIPGAAWPKLGLYTEQDGLIAHLNSWEISELS